MIATVALPNGLVEYPGEDAEAAPSAIEVMAAAGGRTTRPRRTPRPAPVTVSAGGAANGAAVAEPTDRPLVATPAGLPRRNDAEPGESPASTTEPVALAAAPAPTTEPVALVAAPAVTDLPTRSAEPEAPTITSAGLVKRTPAARSTAPADPSPARPVTRTTRSPEEVRRMLSRYRSGLDRGRTIEPGAAGDPESPESPTQGPEE
jgi:hypothetical protein